MATNIIAKERDDGSTSQACSKVLVPRVLLLEWPSFSVFDGIFFHFNLVWASIVWYVGIDEARRTSVRHQVFFWRREVLKSV